MNYKLLKEEYVEELKSNVKLYKHLKSGARILTLENDDINKVFTIGFRTPPQDDTGVPHIMEHSTLCGSKKYPVKDPFVELLKGSLNTFLNAITYPDKTIYPIASCNQKDFDNLMEVYLDAVFYPNVYEHEEIFKQEGWHYELNDINDDITYNGVVYNEMKGAFSNAEEVLLRLSRHMMFPDSSYGFESGGDPLFIPDLTYDLFKSFHKKYYSPANSYIFLYGNLDMDKKLDWLDREYLSKFDLIDVDSKIPYQKPFECCQYEKAYYPISLEEDIKGKTFYSYNWVISDYKDSKLSFALSILDYVLLEAPGAPLKQALLDKKIAKDIISIYEDEMLQPVFSIVGKEARKNKQKQFEKVIYDTLAKLVKKGIDKKSLLSEINYFEFKYRESDYGRSPKGLVYISRVLSTWLYDDEDPLSKTKYNDIFKELKEGIDNHYFEDVIEKYFLNNNHCGLLSLYPSKTLSRKQDKLLRNKLKKYKDSLSKVELLKMVEDTKKLKLYQQTPSTKEELDTIPKLSIADINKEMIKYSNVEDSFKGIKVIRHEVETNGIGYLRFLFDTSKVNPQYLPYLGLLVNVLGVVNTSKRSYQELNKDNNIYTGGINISFNALCDKDNTLRQYLCVDASYLYNNAKYVFDTILEIIKTSNYNDRKRIKEIIDEELSSLYVVLSRSNSTSFTRALSYISSTHYLKEKTNGCDYYLFLKDLANNFDDRFNEMVSIFNELTHTIFRKENLLVSYTSLNDDYKSFMNDFIENLFIDQINEYHFTFKENIKNEGIKIASQVQYVAKVGKFDRNKYTGALQVFSQALNFDYLWIKVRVQGGAYGVSSYFLKNGYVALASYRDPNIKKTIEIYDEIINYIDSFNPSKEDITNYVIGAIGGMDAPCSPREFGDTSMRLYLRGDTNDSLQKTRDEILNVTIKDLKAIKDIFVEAFSKNIICVLGDENKIEENRDILPNIINI